MIPVVDPECLLVDGEKGIAGVVGGGAAGVGEDGSAAAGAAQRVGVGVDRGDGRDALGHFASGSNARHGADAEAQGLAQYASRTGDQVIASKVRATIPGYGNRYYDGLTRNADGTYTAIEAKPGAETYTGIEVKSGTAGLSAHQRAFDGAVDSGQVATATLDGRLIHITHDPRRGEAVTGAFAVTINGDTSFELKPRWGEEEMLKLLGRLDGVERYSIVVSKLSAGVPFDRVDMDRDAQEYIQCAGSFDGRLTAEVREVVDGAAHQYVIGRPPEPPADPAAEPPADPGDADEIVPWGGHEAHVRPNEVLNGREVSDLFLSYYRTGEIPSSYTRRPLDL
jgi:hypothetical protein